MTGTFSSQDGLAKWENGEITWTGDMPVTGAPSIIELSFSDSGGAGDFLVKFEVRAAADITLDPNGGVFSDSEPTWSQIVPVGSDVALPGDADVTRAGALSWWDGQHPDGTGAADGGVEGPPSEIPKPPKTVPPKMVVAAPNAHGETRINRWENQQ